MMSKRPVTPRGSLRRRRPALGLMVESLESRQLLATVSNINDSGPGSLRAAIDQVNLASGPQTIDFAISGSGVHTISPQTPLPPITTPVTINGYSQPGASPNTLIVGDNATILIVLDGSNLGSADILGNGLTIAGGDSTVIGLSVVGFTNDGILLTGKGGDKVQGCFIGVLPDGTTPRGNDLNGIDVDQVPANTIGGTTMNDPTTSTPSKPEGVPFSDDSFSPPKAFQAAARNLVSGNGDNGIRLFGGSFDKSNSNLVSGNYIGTNASGTSSIDNFNGGLLLDRTSNNTIGGANVLHVTDTGIDDSTSDPVAQFEQMFLGNLISGNFFPGIRITSIFGESSENLIQGNLVGTNASGAGPLPGLNNFDGGILIDGSPFGTTIGGVVATTDPITQATVNGARNVISGNEGPGVIIRRGATSSEGFADQDIRVQGNYIGLNINGDSPAGIGNQGSFSVAGDGVLIDGESGVLVGGDTTDLANVIANNTGSGVVIRNSQLQVSGATFNNIVAGNLIGTDPTGAVARGNQGYGVDLENSGSVLIGTGTADVFDQGTGSTPPSFVTITFALPNVIAASGLDGVRIAGTDAKANTVQGNRIGTNLNGNAARSNDGWGVSIINGADNSIGAANVLNPSGSIGTLNGNVIAANGLGGLQISGGGATGNQVLGNLIGTNINGNAALPNIGVGISVESAADGNAIGGPGAGDGNVISGNDGVGVSFSFAGSASKLGNTLVANIIGLSADGTIPIGNNGDGVLVTNSQDVRIGAANVLNGSGQIATRLGNVISANAGNGVEINGGTAGNQVVGNLIGTDKTGTSINVPGGATGNSLSGVVLDGGAANVLIGGTAAGAGNVISGNGGSVSGGSGIALTEGALANTVQGNFIGVDVTGSSGLGNTLDGVLIAGANGNTIGGGAGGAGNVISDNGGVGVRLTLSAVTGTASAQNLISNDRIGTNLLGTAAIGNRQQGVRIELGASSNTVSGSVISGNLKDGILLTDAGTTFNLIRGNKVGVAASGTTALGNQGNGITIVNGAVANFIGEATASGVNVIAANRGVGVLISGALTAENTVLANAIGISANGASIPLGNGAGGVVINLGAFANTIGAANVLNSDGSIATLRGNVIAENSGFGVAIVGSSNGGDTSGNLLIGNLIGTDSTGMAPHANKSGGVEILAPTGSSATHNTVGGTNSGERNIISGNSLTGVLISGPGANNEVVAGNYIGTDAKGAGAVANGGNGVVIDSAGQNTVGGTSAGAGNVISGNLGIGVDVSGTLATLNVVGFNRIGTTADGKTALPNHGDGVKLENGANGNAIAFGNTIAGNAGAGVELIGSLSAATSSNIVAGNLIGLGSVGGPLPNAIGILVNDAATGNVIGGTATTDRNTVSGNTGSGIALVGTSSGTVVLGNFVGNDATFGTHGNTGDGILIASPGNVVGTDPGQTISAPNVVSGNGGNGIDLQTSAASGNLIAGNLIGLNAAGNAAAPNAGDGILLDGAGQNTIGGSASGGQNVIAGNAMNGVHLTGGATANVLQANLIGIRLDATGTAHAQGNALNGVLVEDGAGANLIGVAAAGLVNVISANGQFGVAILGTAGAGNVVQGDLIGTDPTGTIALGNGMSGVLLFGAAAVTVGGTTAGSRNIIAGNAGDGITVTPGTSGDLIAGNLIGTNQSSAAGIGNGRDGIFLDGATLVTIGGTTATSRNVISGNRAHGVELADAAVGNLVAGNYSGTDANGAGTVPNLGDGVLVRDGASGNVIGLGNLNGLGNVISGNQGNGVEIRRTFDASTMTLGADATGNLVAGNLIGTDASGGAARGNGQNGILIDRATGNTIGGDDPGSSGIVNQLGLGNLISANRAEGIALVDGASGNLIVGNLIGVGLGGGQPLPNGLDGILVEGSPANTIGAVIDPSTTSTRRNVISGNGGAGVRVHGGGSTGTLIIGNFIGPDRSGTGQVGNTLDGIVVDGVANVLIGVAPAGAPTPPPVAPGSPLTGFGNVISGNGRSLPGNPSSGILLTGGSNHVLVVGNYIGTDLTGTRAVANGKDGILLAGASDNLIGGALPGQGNIIAGNDQDGVRIDSGSGGNTLIGNAIGTDFQGTPKIGNGDAGVELTTSAGGGNAIGGANGLNPDGTIAQRLGNLIAGNLGDGILASSPSVQPANVILGNVIGTTADTVKALPNFGNGINIDGGAGLIVGGTTASVRNVIAGNVGDGLQIDQATASGNLVLGNYIGFGMVVGPNGPAYFGQANVGSGVAIRGLASRNTIGAGNVIASNIQNGVTLDTVHDNLVTGSTIGLNPAGQPLGNLANGVAINAGWNNLICTGNVISGNDQSGVLLIGAAVFNLIADNRIGTDDAGNGGLGNGLDGILLSANATTGPQANNIALNTIAGNQGSGIELVNPLAQHNSIVANKIGFVAEPRAGQTPDDLGNRVDGITIFNASGNVVGNANGVEGQGNWISGNARSGVEIIGQLAQGNQVAGNVIGAGTAGLVALGNRRDGVTIELDAAFNTIGGSVAGARNLIAGNLDNGVALLDRAFGNVVAGDWIGLNVTGAAALPNAIDGIRIDGASANTIGESTIGSAGSNVIAGNGASGIRISGQSSVGNLVQSDFIGTDWSGTRAVPNRLDGVFIDIAPSNIIGGPTLDTGNVISGNGQFGVDVLGDGGNPTSETIRNNIIGLDRTGTTFDATLGNQSDGISLSLSGGNLIFGNTISNNQGIGIDIFSQPGGNVITGNKIGLDITGTSARGNARTGIFVNNSPSNLIGGATDADRNVIASSNSSPSGGPNVAAGSSIPEASGIQVFGVQAIANQILHNYIGTDITGQAVNDAQGRPLGNLVGIFLNNAGLPHTQDTNGTITPTAVPGFASPLDARNLIQGNLVSGNYQAGIQLSGDGAFGNLVMSNRVGTDSLGVRGLYRVDNGGDPYAGFQNIGILIDNAPGNTIGGPGLAPLGVGDLVGPSGRPGNLIAGNWTGVEAFGLNGRQELIAGNLVGTDRSGTVAIPNLFVGVFIYNAGANTNPTTTPAGQFAPSAPAVPNRIDGNLISGNGYSGVQLAFPLAQYNLVSNNTIGPNIAGNAAPTLVPAVLNQNPTALPLYPTDSTLNAANQTTNRTGVYILNTSFNTIGQNNINGNGRVGVYIDGSTSTNNTVTGNRLQNEFYGVLLFNTLTDANAVDSESAGVLQVSGFTPNIFGNNAQAIRPFTGPAQPDTASSKFPPIPGSIPPASTTPTATTGQASTTTTTGGSNPFANRRLAFRSAGRGQLVATSLRRPRG